MKLKLIYTFLFLNAILTAVPAVSQGHLTLSIQPSDSIEFIRGADVSFLPQIEDLGGVYRVNGVPQDLLKIFKDNGLNYIRLKLWHTPSEDYNDLDHILEMAKRIEQQDMKFLLDFHYSDTWADPGKQNKPAAWAGLPFVVLQDSIYLYTKKVLRALYDQHTLPEMVQLGNEINPGILWNDGRVGGSFDNSGQWSNLGELLKQAVRGVRESCAAGDSVRILIHIANAADNGGCRWFYDRLIAQGVKFDIIGLSFYPWWHGTLNQVRANLNDLAGRYDKDIVIAETAYPWTMQWFDSRGNIVGSTNQLHAGYPATVDGQSAFLRDLIKIIKNVKNDKGIGVFYWEPEYISVQPTGSPWENCTLFDFSGNVLPTLDIFKEKPVEFTPVNVTIRLNTSTLADTLREHHFAQIRGQVDGTSIDNLPDGKRISWDSDSDLILKNIGGDYWEISFQMYPEDELSLKFWTGFNANTGTFQRLGWEGAITPFGEFTGNRRVFVAGVKDTVLSLQYFNSTSENKAQYWRPFESKEDSLTLYFRVNMLKAMTSGRFDPETNGPVSVRGDATLSGGALDWDISKVKLDRELFSVGNGSFWSGACRIAKNAVNTGDTLRYRFFIENHSQNGWESTVFRTFVYTHNLMENSSDTTLHWVYFPPGTTDIPALKSGLLPACPRILSNYPNPFNQSTRIRFILDSRQYIRISVLNILGTEINMLLDKVGDKGTHEVEWNGTDRDGKTQASGLYFIILKSEKTTKSIKIAMIK